MSMFSLPHWKDALTWNSSSPGQARLECVSCMETYATKRCVVAPCSHVYCSKCMVSLIETCLRDESIFPVKCCKQVIPTTQFIGILNTTLRSKYEHKALEFSTSADWRIYCSNGSCSAFLGSSRGETKIMTCSQCRKSTCSGCKQASHPGDTCRGNVESLKLRQMARKERWQTCPGCSAIVEQKAGCNHMTCRCRTEFCYLCGVKWKKCNCPQFGDPGRTDQQPAVEDEVDQRFGGVPGQYGEGNQPIDDEDMPVFDYQYFLGDAPLHAHDTDLDDNLRPYLYYESSEDEGPYINPYEDLNNEPGHGEYDEDLYFNPYERTQDLLNVFLPDDNSEDEGPYINPYAPSTSGAACPPSTVTAEPDDEDTGAYDASDEEDSHPYPTQSYDSSHGEDVYINPYDSVPDFRHLHIDDFSDDEGPYINPYDSAPTLPDTCSHVTYYSDVSDEEGVYVNPYDIDNSSFYYDSD
ncbi:hypothetical protein JOM56_013247 [Amanita muscaria]